MARIKRLEVRDPHRSDDYDDGVRLVRIMVPGADHDGPVRRMTEAEAKARGRLWVPGRDVRYDRAEGESGAADE